MFIMQLSLKSSQEVLLLLDVCFDQIKRLKKMVHDVKQKKRGTLKRKEIKNAKCQKLKKPQGILVLKPQQSGKKLLFQS